jgi:hypothetical protein
VARYLLLFQVTDGCGKQDFAPLAGIDRQKLKEFVMKKTSILSSLALLAAVLMLSGCIFPYWGDDYGGRHHGGGHHDNGRR